MQEPLPVLYSFRRCPYAMRARLALAVSGQACILREVELRNRPPQLREVSPKATVPVLVLADGDVIEESLEIMHWTLNRQDPENWLRPEAGQRDEAEELITNCDGEFKAHLDRYKYSDRYEGAKPEESRALAAEFLHALDRRLNGAGYLLGPNTCLADMAILPFVRQFALADRDWFDAQAWTHLRRWLDDFVASELFERIMKKHPVWQPDANDLIADWRG